LPPLQGPSPYSIQSQLEKYISEKGVSCIDGLNNLQQLQNYQFSPGNLTTKIEFSAAAVRAEVDSKVMVSSQGVSEPVAVPLVIKGTVFIRLGQLYSTIKEIIQYDNNFLDYNILDDTRAGVFMVHTQPRTLAFKTLENVSFTSNYGVNEDEFMLNDTGSLDGPFVFKFARKNRYPALDYIPHISEPKTLFEFVLFSNDTLKIEADAADPDEDSISFSYHGWKADYDSTWNDATRTQQITQPIPENYWETAALFQNTGSDSEINLTEADIGFHNFTVNISDSSLSDYQIIRVLVDRRLVAEIEGNNLYDDVDNSDVSIEDPYLLNVTSSTVLLDPTTQYTYDWWDSTAQIYKGDVSCLLLPITTARCFTTIPSINNMVGPFMPPLTPRTVGLEITAMGLTNQTASTSINVSVHQCLPHRNPDSPPYPFHTTDDPFQADHTCCSDNFVVETGKECMKTEKYTCLVGTGQGAGITGVMQEDPNNPLRLVPAAIQDTTTPITDTNVNDIFKIDFIQYCGKRGNACSGEINYNLTREFLCADKDTSKGEDETCTGPAKNKSCEINPTNPQCVDYEPGETFESVFLTGLQWNGICNEHPGCSPNTALSLPEGKYGQGGPLACKALCDGNGGCTYATNCVCDSSCSNNVDSDCDGKLPGEAWDEDFGIIDWITGREIRNETGCNLNCEKVDCGEYAFFPSQYDCAEPGQAINDDYCNEGYDAVGGNCV